MKIRLVNSNDLPFLRDLTNREIATGYAHFCKAPLSMDWWKARFDRDHRTHPWLLAEEEGTPLGYAKATPYSTREAYDWTVSLSIYLDVTGQGIGTALYEVLFPLLERQQFVTALAGIALPNPASVRLHEKFGGVPYGVQEAVGYKLGAWYDIGWWQFDLAPRSTDPPPPLEVQEAWRTPGATGR